MAKRRKNIITDPVTLSVEAELHRRHYCDWIMPHYHDGTSYHRCPRAKRTGQECRCRLWDPAVDRDWIWRVVPPLKEEGDAS